MKKLGLILVTLFFSGFLAGQEKPKVAVLELQPLEVKKSLAVMVSDMLSTDLASDRNIIVIEKMQIARVLNEQGFQQTGVTDQDKAVEVGKLLNATHVVLGSVSRLGGKYLINVKLVSVETGGIVAAQKESVREENRIEDAVSRISATLSEKFAPSKTSSKAAEPVVVPVQPPAAPVTQQNDEIVLNVKKPRAVPTEKPSEPVVAPPKKQTKKAAPPKNPDESAREHAKKAHQELDEATSSQ